MYGLGGANNIDFPGGVLGPISLVGTNFEDHTKGGQKQILDEGNHPLPVPEPSTLLLAGSGLIFLFHRIRKSVVGP
jgi:hypothetical protein